MVIFLDGDNVTWTSYTPIDHVQWQISNQGLHGRNLFFRYFCGVGTLTFFSRLHQHMLPLVQQ